jgi:CheY-like chemotaxis protein
MARSALDAADRGKRLTESLLSFARKQALHPEPVDVNALILDFLPLLRQAAGEFVRLETAFAAEACAANVDAVHFQSALLNLVINARDSMPSGGQIVLSTRLVQLGAGDLIGSDARDGRFVLVEVSDTGSGMTPEVAAKAFDPFFTTKVAAKGSGLGLSQVYGFARQSGGMASIHSEIGQGTSVSIFLPFWAQDVARPSRWPARSAAERRSLRVLLVDDDIDVLMTLREGLKTLGWEVLIAPDGDAALGMLDRYGAIDVLVSDISMPAGMSGPDLAYAARRRRPDLPILLISGLPAAAQDTGFEFEILQKPFLPEQLADRISNAAGN